MKTEFKKGDVAVCIASRGYCFTTGKEYVIIGYESECSCPNTGFTWPDYVWVEDDYENTVCCHAHRFKIKE